MKTLCTLCNVVLLLVLCSQTWAAKPEQIMTVQGVIREQRANIKSLDAWNAPGDPYYILELAKKSGQDSHHDYALRPSEQVSTEDLQKFVGQRVTLTGYYFEGERPKAALESIVEQVPIEPKLSVDQEGKPVSTGWQAMKRGWGLVVLSIAKAPPATVTMSGAVIDYEWAHASNRLALLIKEHQQSLLIIVDATGKMPTVRIPVPKGYSPGCFAWLADDSGFLLAMAKPEQEDEFAEDNFYRYTFARKQFVQVYQDIERQFADVFSIEVDDDSGFWAAASVGEGHPDLAIYKNDKTVLLTDVYPGSISPVLWQDHHLWIVTEAYLEFGFTREERSKNPRFDAEKYPERDWGNGVAYRIDPVTKQAAFDPIEMKTLETIIDISYDHRYRSKLIRNDGSFTLEFVPQ